jgi:hypothetical protein
MLSTRVSSIQYKDDDNDFANQFLVRLAGNIDGPVTDDELEGVSEMIKTAENDIVCAVGCLIEAYANRNMAPNVARYRARIFSEGVMYRNHVFPEAGLLVESLQKFFEFYLDFHLDDFEDNLDDFKDMLSAMKEQCLLAAESTKKVESNHQFVLNRLVFVAEEMGRAMEGLHCQTNEIEGMIERTNNMKWSERAMVAAKNLYKLLENGAMGIEDRNHSGLSREKSEIVEDLYSAARELAPLLEALRHLSTAISAMAMIVEKIKRELSKLGTFKLENQKLHWKKMSKRAHLIHGTCDMYLAMRLRIDPLLLGIPERTSEKFKEDWLESFNHHCKFN